MFTIQNLSHTYSVRRLVESDAPMILALEQGNPLYFKYCPPAPDISAVLEDMKALPPGKTYADKHYIGFFAENELIAVMDLITGYPDENTAFIGFFMVDKAHSGKGVGNRIIGEMLSAVCESGYTKCRLGYMKGNPQSKAFWEKCGFLPTGVEAENEQGTVVVMQKYSITL